jgi:hypothetical protein
MTRIIDFHTHAFPDSLALRAMEALSSGAEDWPACHDGTIGGLLRSMDEAGIDSAVVCSIATKPTQERPILEWSKSIASHRIIPFISLHPNGAARDQEDLLDEAVDAGIKGVKFHCMYQNFAADEERVYRMYEAIAERGLIALFHAGFDICWPESDVVSPARLLKVHRRVPNLRMVAAHYGGWRMWEEVAEKLAGEEIYFDTAFTLGQIKDETWDKIWNRHSPDRILFATDSPWMDQKKDLERLREKVGTGEAFNKLASQNASKLLGLE